MHAKFISAVLLSLLLVPSFLFASDENGDLARQRSKPQNEKNTVNKNRETHRPAPVPPEDEVTKEIDAILEDEKNNPPEKAHASSGEDLHVPTEIHLRSQIMEDDLNYKTILAFITSGYKHISHDDAKSIARYLVDYGKEHNIDPKLAAALIARESAFNKEAVSVTGAKGLGQIKNFNYPSLEIKNPFDIQQNVGGTVKYLRRMMDIWQHKSEQVSLALASYYKGHGAVKRDNEQLDEKTKGYVRDILKKYDELVATQEQIKK